MGGGEIELAKVSAYKAMYLGLLSSIFGTSILFAIAPFLPSLLTPDPILQRIIFELLPLVGFGQISMSIGMVCWNILSAQGRIRLATIVEFVVSWLFMMPISAVLVFLYNLNLLGMVGPLVISYTIGGVTVVYFVITSDWETLSAKIILRNGGNLSYDEVSLIPSE